MTGTLSVFAHEIDWLLNPDMRVDHASIEGDVNWAAITDSVAAYAPNAKFNAIDAPVAKGFAASANIFPPGQPRLYIYLHPTTGEIQGTSSGPDVHQVLANIHRSLYLPGKLGGLVVPSMSIFLATSLVTALIVHKKWWRGFFRPIRTHSARTMVGDFHRLVGVWTIWFALLAALCGFWYTVEKIGGAAPPQPFYSKPGVEITAEQAAAAFPKMLRTTQEAYPELRLKQIIFPNERLGAFKFQGQYKAILVRARSNVVWVDAETGSIELFNDGRNLSIHQRISEMADPLHFGVFGGVWTKTIWLIFGALLTSMSLSGVAIYSLRLLKMERKPLSVVSFAISYLRGVGLFILPTAGVVLLGLALLFAKAIF